MVRRPTAILISGRGSNMVSLVDAASASDFAAEIVLVASNRADAPGLATARARGLPTAVVAHNAFGQDREAHERALAEQLERAGADVVCLAGYMRLLTPWLVTRYAGRMLNIHPSLLPAFPGLDTHARALRAGVRLHGCTVHVVTVEMDGGPILAQAAVPVLPGDDPGALAQRVLVQEHRLYPAALAAFASGGAGPSPEALPDALSALLNPLPLRALPRPASKV